VDATKFRFDEYSLFRDLVAPQDARMRVMYCTIIDESFVPRALVLRRSIAKHSPAANFAFYCVDDAAAKLLAQYAGVQDIIVPPGSYETHGLRALKNVRKLNEYCWTCKSAILIHAARSEPRPQWVVWLDSDMMAYGDMGSILKVNANASVVLTPHRFSLPKFAAYEPVVGRFNAGFVAFQTTGEGLAALDWWMEQSLQGCPAEPMDGRYADQKYLDAIPELFLGAITNTSPGLNCAPWNVFGRNIAVDANRVTVDGTQLLLYHFQGLKIIRNWAFDLYGSTPSLPRLAKSAIYGPYLQALSAQIRDCAARLDRPQFGIDRDFAGLAGFVAAVKRMRWSPNLVLKF
jgi:hypothetical protein